MSKKRRDATLLLTDRALRDISEIESYSVAEGGQPVAEKYVSDLEAALSRIRDRPDLLRAEVDLHPSLRFHRVNKHLLACDVRKETIIVLTVIHASRDIPSRLAELQPTLAVEIELLHKQLERQARRRG